MTLFSCRRHFNERERLECKTRQAEKSYVLKQRPEVKNVTTASLNVGCPWNSQKSKVLFFFQTPENQLISHSKEQFTLKIHSFPLTCSVFFIFIHVGCFGSRNSDPVTGDDPETLWAASCWNYFLSVSSRRTLISQYHHWAQDLIWFSLIYFS